MRIFTRIIRDKKLLAMFYSLVFCLFVISGPADATNVSGPISMDTTWTSANSPYVVTGSVTVNSGVTLTIELGTVVKFQVGRGLYINGTLRAEGNPDNLNPPPSSIVFTSLKDDTYGGDTNGDGSSSSPANGDWNLLSFSATSTNNLLDNTIIRYAGGYPASASVSTATSSLIISDSTVENGRVYGIYVSSASPQITRKITGNIIRNNSNSGIYLKNSPGTTITGNSISGNGTLGGGYPIYLDSASVNSTASISGNTINGNYRNGIFISSSSATLSTSATWVADAPYIFSGLTVSQGVTLTMKPGTVVKFTGGAGLVINGTLNADGTPVGEPHQAIIFTSYKDDTYGGDTNGDGSSSPRLGDWTALSFSSTSTNNLLDNVIVRYGSNNMQAYTSSLTVSNSTVEYGYTGIRVSGASPTITGSVIRNNSNSGIYLTESPGTTINGNTVISGNGYGSGNYAIYLDSASVNSTASISGNTISGNYRNGIYISSGATLTTSAAWVADAPYIVTGLTVSSAVILTMQPGTVVKFHDGYGLVINGILTADGSLEQPIIFTSFYDDTYGGDTNGDGSSSSPYNHRWGSLSLTSSSSNSLLDNVIVRYGGSNGSYANISTATSSLTISNSTVENGNRGIYVSNASPTITGSVIRNNFNYGIYLTNSPGTTIIGNSISGNGFRSIYNDTSSAIVTAENNYWGDESGPYDPYDDRATGGWYNPDGAGNRVSDYVDYEPWLDEFPQCVDSDGDGYGSEATTDLGRLNCSNGPEFDCDDENALEHPNQIWYYDLDNDGYGSGLFLVQCLQPDGSYKVFSELTDLGDCDDSDPDINPVTYWYPDHDGDGYGNQAISLQQCDQPEGYVMDNTDCDDNDANMYPDGPGVRIPGTPSLYTLTLQEGYDAALGGDTIQSKAYVFDEDPLLFDQNKSVIIESGYDCSYLSNTGTSAVSGDVTISDGAVTIHSGTFNVQ